MKRIHLKPIPFYIQMTVFLPLVMIFLLCVGILVFNRLQNVSSKEEVPVAETPAPPVGVLCILREGETAFYTAVTVDPATRTVSARPLNDTAFHDMYLAHGAAFLREYLYNNGVAVDFYVDVTFEELRELLQYLGDGVAVTLPQAVAYTDAAGLSVSFPAGMLNLSANRTADLLRGIVGRDTATDTVAAMWADILCRYLVKERETAADYKALADVGETDIRIYDFHAALPHIKKMTARGSLGKS